MNAYIFLCLIPPGLFLLLLLLLDGFSLTRWDRLLQTLLGGALCCVLSHVLFALFPDAENIFSLTIFQELTKGLIIYFMVRSGKIALSGDSTIYGAATGAGFALLEECILFSGMSDVHFWHLLLEDFDISLLHIGCTSTLAQMLVMAKSKASQRNRWYAPLLIYFAFLLAMIIHYIHLLEPLPVLAMVVLLTVYFAFSKWALFRKNEKYIHQWVDDCINNEITLLGSIKRGELGQTHAGEYLMTLKERFDPEVFFDMCCYVEEFLELSIAAKSNLILKEAGLPRRTLPSSEARIAEMRALRKRIGKVGELAIRPIVKINDVDQWVVNELI